jgi:hypothetical protein
VAVEHDQVVVLDVAVDHADIVQRGERRRGLRADRHHRRQLDRPAVADRAERLALEQLHDQVRHAVAGPRGPEDLDDAGVVGARREVELGEQALDHLGLVGELRIEDLESGALAGDLMYGEVDTTHAASRDGRHDLVTVEPRQAATRRPRERQDVAVEHPERLRRREHAGPRCIVDAMRTGHALAA